MLQQWSLPKRFPSKFFCCWFLSFSSIFIYLSLAISQKQLLQTPPRKLPIERFFSFLFLVPSLRFDNNRSFPILKLLVFEYFYFHFLQFPVHKPHLVYVVYLFRFGYWMINFDLKSFYLRY